MNSKILRSLEECASEKDRWNALAARVSDDVSLTFEWHLALKQSRLNSEEVPVLWLEDSGGVAGILPFHTYRQTVRGIPLRFISPLAQLHANHDTLLLRDDSLQMVHKALGCLEEGGYRWHAFTCTVSEGSHIFSEIAVESRSGDASLDVTWGRKSPFFPLEGPADIFLKRKTAKFRNDVFSRTRALNRDGKVELEIRTEEYDLPEALEKVLRIEKESWKEKQSTSITARPWEASFYDHLSPLATKLQWLRIYILNFDGEPIAHQYGLVYQNRYFLLKTSYDRRFKKYSPGVILCWKVVEDLIGMGVAEFDFLGDSEPHKLRWTDRVRKHASFLLFNRGFYPNMAVLLGKLKKSALLPGGASGRILRSGDI